MTIRAGDIAPNPTLMGPEGANPLYERSNRKLIVLLFGPADPPLEWEKVIVEAENSEGEVKIVRILPSNGDPVPGLLLDPTLEAHRRFDAYDWKEMRPIPALVVLNNAGLVRLAVGNLDEGWGPLFKIIAAHLSRIQTKKAS